MNAPRRTLIGSFCMALATLTAAPVHSAPNPAGYWEGTISVPNSQLGIGVELVRGTADRWSGTISIPAQGLRDHVLTNLTVKGADVGFALPGIPGDPAFKGTLAADGKTISGDFSQGGQTIPFTLEKKSAKPKPPGSATPAKGVPGKGLVGAWQGSLKPAPIVELRLVLEVTNNAAGKPTGVLISVDQGEVRIPVTTLTTEGSAVTLDVPSVGGSFEGKLNAEGSEIAGDWTQGGQSTPLVFKRLPARPQPSRP